MEKGFQREKNHGDITMTMTVLTVHRFLSLLCTTISSQKAIEFYLLAANCRILDDERKRKYHLQDHKRKESKREERKKKRQK